MTQFMPFDLMEANSDEDSIKIIQEPSVCLCCLSNNVQLVTLATCKHTSFFELFFKFKFQYQDSVVCVECHHLLNKIEQFKLQVEKCLGVLWTEKDPPAQPTKKFQNLSSTETNFTNSRDSDEEQPKQDPEEATTSASANTEQHYHILTTEVKVEYDSSDDDTSVPLSEIKKKEVEKVKKKKNNQVTEKKKKDAKVKNPNRVIVRKKRSLTELDEKYVGKIIVRIIDKEELMKEREEDARKPIYVRLPYKCEYCIMGFDHEKNFQDHMKRKHTMKKDGFLCDICKSVLKSQVVFGEHTRKHFRRYECLECGKRTNSIYSIAEHYKDYHGSIDTKFECKECDFTTESHRRFRYHREKHQRKDLPTCDECGNTFATTYGLKVHMFTVHAHSSRVYSCAECGKVYRAKSGLRAHTLAAHAQRPAYCASCRAHFRTEQGLAHHLKTHSAHVSEEDKKFKCDDCDSRYLTKAALQEHVNFLHLKKIKHECQKCGKVFKNSSSLKKHIDYVHNKIRPPRDKICDHCGRGFFALSILRAHIRTHTGERPLQCTKCPATFAQSAALYTHNKLLHSGARTQK